MASGETERYLCPSEDGERRDRALPVSQRGRRAVRPSATRVPVRMVSGENEIYLCPSEDVHCDLQDDRFALIFTLASFALSFMTLPCGFLFDSFGTMVTRFLAISLYIAATLMIAFSTAASAALLFPAACMIAVGGIIIYMTNIQVGNLFGNNQSTIITLYTGAFGSSAVVFLLVKVLYEVGLSLRSMFLFISCLSFIHIVSTFFLLPRTRFPHPVPEGYTYGAHPTHRTIGRRFTLEHVGGNEEQVPSFRSCIFSSFFFTHLLWLSIIQLRHFLFIGTFNPMLALLADGDSKQVSRFTNAFALTQMCSVFCAPWNGLIMDRHKRKDKSPDIVSGNPGRLASMRSAIISLAITVTQAVLFAICAAIPVLEAQYLTFALQVINRSFLYGGDAAFIAVTFPHCHFGKVYGLAQAVSAIVSLLQYPCFTFIQGPLQDNPFYLNVGFIALVALAYAHPINVYLHCRREAQRDGAVKHPPDDAPRQDH
ncbi:solute carrier family 43 member 3-like [Carcharodon carcharias]|uniref:solute carrier family 43 member 3-like n=1 Tax=Carcharodon carcharias TaxID=13397 RepID=UPI001B7F35DE|nr:solute carrier family 43 member 3-like [Carcharodon carcharias]